MNQYILADNQPLTAIALENILRNDGEIKIHRASGRKELVKHDNKELTFLSALCII